MSEELMPYSGSMEAKDLSDEDVVGVTLDPQQTIEQGGIRLLISTALGKADALQVTLQARAEYEAVIFHLQEAMQALDELGVVE